ncbi:FAD-dependent oxidoreductase [Bifidobacterium psychraerophilum]|uniref:Oxidoreductase n=1 Tax=Bifidobacterium psychraerophilum TaxID=218140 RepID=A0A087CLQ5_9BIFI|nr:FAD-dependent oxidoreductase [Bifidobacterium psychraerophilum]KFI84205.1 oxidoreductase [Bifidobacterium psychraerophilum]PKA94061.1 putative ferric reductase [Bifidobacterium psychraerophilum DSM 22366]
MLRRLQIPLTLTWLTVLFVVPMPLIVLLSNGLSPLYASSALGIQAGVIAYSWMLTAVVLSTRPHWLDRLIGLPNIYMIHGILSLGAIALAFMHRTVLPSSGIIALTGNTAFWIFVGVGVWSMVFMAGWLTTRVPLLGRIKRFLERVFRHEFSVWLHRLNLLAVMLIFIHVQLIDIVNTIRPFMIAFDAFALLAAVLYIRSKLMQAFAARKGTVESSEIIAPGVLQLDIHVPSQRGSWEVGDFVFIRFPEIKGLREYHPFSIVSLPHRDARLRFAIRGDGDFTKSLVNMVKEGSVVEVLPPFGRYRRFLDERGDNRPIVIFAGGIGVTPLVPVALAYEDSGRPIRFLYTARTEDQLLYADELERWSLQEHCDLMLQAGRFTPDELSSAMLPNAVYLIGGPAPMLRSTRRLLVSQGVRADDICYEPFTW